MHQYLLHLLVRHKSVSFVVVESVMVGFALRMAQLLVVIYAGYQLLNNKQYFAFERPRGFANSWADYYSPSTSVQPYCNNSQYDFEWSPTWTYHDNLCGAFETGEVVHKLDSGGIYIQTYFQESIVTSLNCSYSGELCETSVRDNTNQFVTGVEGISVGINFASHTSFRIDKDVKTQVMDHDGQTVLATFERGGALSIPLEMALKAAGISSLDARNKDAYESFSTGFASYRMTGVLLLFQFEFSNTDNYDGSEVTSKLIIIDAHVGWAGTGPETDALEYEDAGNGNFHTVVQEGYSYGVKIQMVYSGQVGRPTFERAISVIIEYAVLFTFASLFADYIAEFVDPKVKKDFRKKTTVATVATKWFRRNPLRRMKSSPINNDEDGHVTPSA